MRSSGEGDMKEVRIGVVGAGAWGTALACQAHRAGRRVVLWARRPEVAAAINRQSATMKWMARFYGRVCRNYALQVLARGGVYIAGGVAAKVPDMVLHDEFKREFHNSTTMAHVLRNIPVFLNSSEDSGLWGAAVVGRQMLKGV